jgi:hypothetical protein
MGNRSIPNPFGGLWDQFIKRLLDRGVDPERTRWYVIRAECYLRSAPRDSLALHRAEDVHAYLDSAGRSGKLEDWQFRQLVDALEILFVDTAKAPWAGSFDWENWHATDQSLSREQPTSNRDLSQTAPPIPLKTEPKNRLAT